MHKIIFTGFSNESTAETARVELLKKQEKGTLGLDDAVVITQSPKGGIKLKHTYEFTPDNTLLGSWVGMLIGAILGVPFGPAGPLVGTVTGTALGAALGALADLSELAEIQEELVEVLNPSNSALIVITDDTHAPEVIKTLEQSPDTRGEIKQRAISNETEQKLKKAMEAA